MVFPHHQLWPKASNARRDRGSYRRSVARLRRVLGSKDSKVRTLFVLAVAEGEGSLEVLRDEHWKPPGQGKKGKCPSVPDCGGPELCSRAEILRLYECLQQKAKGPFHLDVVYLLKSLKGKKTEKTRTPRSSVVLQRRSGNQSLRVCEMWCKGENTGLAFREDADMLAFHKLITDSNRRPFVREEVRKSRPALFRL